MDEHLRVPGGQNVLRRMGKPSSVLMRCLLEVMGVCDEHDLTEFNEVGALIYIEQQGKDRNCTHIIAEVLSIYEQDC